MSGSIPPRILVLDDYPHFRTICSDILDRQGFAVVTVGTVSEACAVLSAGDIDIVLSDFNLSGEFGTDVLEWMRCHAIRAPFVLMTADPEDRRVQMLESEQIPVIPKRDLVKLLVATVRETLGVSAAVSV